MNAADLEKAHFIHVMREAPFLEQALREGLMFTDHKVEFNPFGAAEQGVEEFVKYAIPRIEEKARALGATDTNLQTLARLIGKMHGALPMICFTEALDSRELSNHFLNFGAYGVVVRREWLEANGGDRVIYAGERSALTKLLHQTFFEFQLACLHVVNGKALFDSAPLKRMLDIFAYVQGRDQMAEAEWRIAGAHGFFGKKRNTGDRIALPLDQIDAVLVQNPEDIANFKAILVDLAAVQGAAEVPPVLRQPESLKLLGEV